MCLEVFLEVFHSDVRMKCVFFSRENDFNPTFFNNIPYDFPSYLVTLKK